ncbi:MAG: NrsF family protein [Polyangiaceae bacterium]
MTDLDLPADPADLERELEACRDLLGQHLAEEEPRPDELSALRSGVEGAVAKEQGLVASLRALATPVRIVLLVTAMVGLGAVSGIASPRPDLDSYPGLRMGLVLALLILLTGAASWRLLRPLHLPSPSVLSSRLMLLGGMLAPFVIALVPLHDHAGATPGSGVAFAVACGKCLGYGSLFGLPVFGLAAALRRSDVDGPAVAALAGVAAGLAGNAALQLHCPIIDPAHLIVGHGLLLLVYGALASRWRPLAETRR